MKIDTQRANLVWHSFRSLPAWVQIWVGLILIPVNTAGFIFWDTFSGHCIALAAILIMLTNGPLMWFYAGMNKALSIPHLFIWIPLNIILIGRLLGDWGGGPLSFQEALLAIVVLAINSISLVFDVADSWHWVQGDRSTPGVSDGGLQRH